MPLCRAKKTRDRDETDEYIWRSGYIYRYRHRTPTPSPSMEYEVWLDYRESNNTMTVRMGNSGRGWFNDNFEIIVPKGTQQTENICQQ